MQGGSFPLEQQRSRERKRSKEERYGSSHGKKVHFGFPGLSKYFIHLTFITFLLIKHPVMNQNKYFDYFNYTKVSLKPLKCVI